jgi:bifunctional non-homologous end joining protein LigD
VLPLIDPIRPLLGRSVPRGREWLYEVKLDGFRGTLYVERGSAFFRSKTKRRMRRFDDLALLVARTLEVREAIVDGEILVMREGRPHSAALMRNEDPPSYAAFDLLWVDGRDVRPLPLWRRKRMLRRLTDGSAVGYVDDSSDARLFESAVQLDLEGIVAKRRSDPYAPHTEWIKVKHGGYSQNEGRHELFGER